MTETQEKRTAFLVHIYDRDHVLRIGPGLPGIFSWDRAGCLCIYDRGFLPHSFMIQLPSGLFSPESEMTAVDLISYFAPYINQTALAGFVYSSALKSSAGFAHLLDVKINPPCGARLIFSAPFPALRAM